MTKPHNCQKGCPICNPPPADEKTPPSRCTVDQIIQRGPTPVDAVCPHCGANGYWVPCLKKYVCYKNHAHLWFAYNYDLLSNAQPHAESDSVQSDVVRDFEERITPHILRYWDRDRIVRFAKHLLGDKCQACRDGDIQ